ncbi:MAG: class I SAM-dependent methyltransferase [Planctomycetes bacterium]|nr:class I SAM-dependent methyltransferase [Planctomycetota bacterium]
MHERHHDKTFTAEDYDEQYYVGHIRRYEEGVYANRVRFISKYLEGMSGGLLLDAGCGMGFFSEIALELGAKVVSLDFSPSALRVYRARAERKERAKDPRRLLAGSVEELPFPDGTFDFAMAIDVIEHLYHPDRMLEEVLRVLKPGGRAIIETDNDATWFTKRGFRRINHWFESRTPVYQRLAKIRAEVPSSSLHVETFDIHTLDARLQKIGFSVVKSETFPYLSAPARDAVIRMPGLRSISNALGGENCMIFLAEKPRR